MLAQMLVLVWMLIWQCILRSVQGGLFMGRSGGGGGGGFSGGGFSGGGRSSGGFSGGGRSMGHSGGRSGGSSHFGAGRPPHRPPVGGPTIIRTGGHGGNYGNRAPYNNGHNGRNNGGSGGNGCGTVILVLVVFMILMACMFMFVNTSVTTESGTVSGNVAQSTYEREKLADGLVNETGYLTDEAGWFADKSAVESGMRQFYNETGVQPYLYLLPNGETTSVSELNTLAEELYDQLFTDEAHFLLVFCDDNFGSYNCGYVVGAQAKTVMDDQAIGILADYLDRYYNDYSISEEQIFSYTFAKTGERIMTVQESPLPVIFISLAVIVVAVIIGMTIRSRNERKRREMEQMEEILQTPLEKFGDSDAENLAKKYSE